MLNTSRKYLHRESKVLMSQEKHNRQAGCKLELVHCGRTHRHKRKGEECSSIILMRRMLEQRVQSPSQQMSMPVSNNLSELDILSDDTGHNISLLFFMIVQLLRSYDLSRQRKKNKTTHLVVSVIRHASIQQHRGGPLPYCGFVRIRSRSWSPPRLPKRSGLPHSMRCLIQDIPRTAPLEGQSDCDIGR